jgi:hypothetical protein
MLLMGGLLGISIGKICAFGTAITQLHLSRSSEATLKLLVRTRIGGFNDMTKMRRQRVRRVRRIPYNGMPMR